MLHALTFSRGIARIPYLANLLGVGAISRINPVLCNWPLLPGNTRHKHSGKIVLGWGLKENTERPRQFALRHGIPYLVLEDGFLRSVGLSSPENPPLSLVVDDTGIYYDATAASRLENILNGYRDAVPGLLPVCVSSNQQADPLEDEALLDRAHRCIEKIVSNHLSKYNSSPDACFEPAEKPRVLVVDQTVGDLSIEYGLASAESFEQMLHAAIEDHPQAEILVKIHPDVIAGKKQGHLLGAGIHPRVRVLDTNINPISLLRQVEHVYVVSSQIGFEALLAGRQVTCFGVPFYAGWGLTDDRIESPRRNKRRSLGQLFAAACILYSRYRNPYSGEACEVEVVIDCLALQRHWFNENTGDLYCYGFSFWKRGFVRSYLYAPWNSVHFVRSVRQLQANAQGNDARIVVWGRNETSEVRALSENRQIPVWRIEDGFMRSVGLGSDLEVPASLVVDKQGIYFNPSQPSDLEVILQNHSFTDEELARARGLRETIVDSGMSKYNVGRMQPLQYTASPGQQTILVPGQVEDDASIQSGCRDIRTNAQLLRAVRKATPEANIIYKPHPDVLSRNRSNAVEPENSNIYQHLVTDTSISLCLDSVDEVHTMTSLAGFEGLLRGKRVVTYGIPFYAGWGLTEDRQQIERRTRRLTLDELVAGCLIVYPRYMFDAKVFAPPEAALVKMQNRCSSVNNKNQIISSRITRTGRKLGNLVSGLFYAR